MSDNEPRCESCGVAWREHLGMQGTCAKLRVAEQRIARLISVTSGLCGYASSAGFIPSISKRWLDGLVLRLNAASEACGSTTRYEIDGENIKVVCQ